MTRSATRLTCLKTTRFDLQLLWPDPTLTWPDLNQTRPARFTMSTQYPSSIRIFIISPNLSSLWLYSIVQLTQKKTKIITHEFEQILGDLAIVVLVTKMRSFKFAMLLLSLWVITLLSLTKTESAPTYSTHYCSNSTFFIANSTYQTNLNLVLSSLNSNATDNNNNGFYNASAGDNPADDVVSGLFLCRGDVNTAVC